MIAHRRLGDRGVREFRKDATIQRTRGVPLLARRLAIRSQNLINESATAPSFGLARFG
jgi:hypothetical protein